MSGTPPTNSSDSPELNAFADKSQRIKNETGCVGSESKKMWENIVHELRAARKEDNPNVHLEQAQAQPVTIKEKTR